MAKTPIVVLALLALIGAFAMGAHASSTGSCAATHDLTDCLSPAHQQEPLLAQVGSGLGSGIPARKQAAGQLGPLCRDYREFTERRPTVDRQQVALLPKFQMLEEACLREGLPPSLQRYACTVSGKQYARGSCCVGPWDCLNSNQASCDAMESFCTALGAAWTKE